MAEVPEVDYTAEEEAAMGGETQPEGETSSVKTPEGVKAEPTEVRTSAKPLEEVRQESRDNQEVTTPGDKAQEEVGTSKGASSSQENPGQTGNEPEQGEYWAFLLSARFKESPTATASAAALSAAPFSLAFS